MDLLDLLLQPGDRVRVMDGVNQGRTGTVIAWEGEKVIVQPDGEGEPRAIAPKRLAHIPSVNGSPSGSTAVPNGLQNGSPSGSTAVPNGLQGAIATLEGECTRLRSTALVDCWLKSWVRKSKDGKVLAEYHRLHFNAASKKKPEYVSAEDVPVLQERIANGRKLKILRAAIAILRAAGEF